MLPLLTAWNTSRIVPWNNSWNCHVPLPDLGLRKPEHVPRGLHKSRLVQNHLNVHVNVAWRYVAKFIGYSRPSVSRIVEAASIFQRLRHTWSSTTTNLYTAIVICPLQCRSYACETWKWTAMIAHRLDVFHRRCLRTILGISWRDHATNEDVMRRAGTGRLQDIVTTSRRKMAGHVLRLQRERPAHIATMCWVPEDGRRKMGRPKTTWWSTFKEDLEEMGVSWHGARRFATDRERWRVLVARRSERNKRT